MKIFDTVIEKFVILRGGVQMVSTTVS